MFLQSPPPYDREGGYDHREALFGSPPYGSSIRGVVFYANSTLCNPTRQADIDAPYGGYPQRYDGSTWLEAATDEQDGVSSFILVVDRGDCTFVSKVRRITTERTRRRNGSRGLCILGVFVWLNA